jgi:hypothetical protein
MASFLNMKKRPGHGGRTPRKKLAMTRSTGPDPSTRSERRRRGGEYGPGIPAESLCQSQVDQHRALGLTADLVDGHHGRKGVGGFDGASGLPEDVDDAIDPQFHRALADLNDESLREHAPCGSRHRSTGSRLLE